MSERKEQPIKNPNIPPAIPYSAPKQEPANPNTPTFPFTAPKKKPTI